MAKTPENKKTSSANSPVLDRILGLFTRPLDRRREDSTPRRRGLVVTSAILVSVLLWFTFTMRESHTRILQFNTDVVNLPDEQALAQLPPQNVRVQVEADGWSLLRLHLNPPSVPINAARSDILIRDALPDLPKNVDVKSISPSSLTLRKERRITRTVPIELRGAISTPPTHDLVDSPRLTPDSVQISGAASVISQIGSWPTREVRVTSLRDTLERRIPLSDSLENLVSRNINSAVLFVVSEQFTEGSREIDVTVQGQPANQQLVTLEPSSIRVRYRVLLSQYHDAMQAMDFYATVAFDAIRADTTGRVRPVLHEPRGIELRDVEMLPPILGYYERID